VPIEGIDRKQLEELAEADVSVSVPASFLLALVVKLERLEEEISGLKRTSRTSSKPPSSDRNNPNKPDKKKGKGGKRKRKPGAQKGHQGKTLKDRERDGGRCVGERTLNRLQRSIISSAKKKTINVLQILQATLSTPQKAQEMLLG
jgi:hypothetical protein